MSYADKVKGEVMAKVSLQVNTDKAQQYGWTDYTMEMLAGKIYDYYYKKGLVGEFLEMQVISTFNWYTGGHRVCRDMFELLMGIKEYR